RILLGTWALTGNNKETVFRQAQRVRALVRRDFQQALERFDVLLMPTSPWPAFPLGGSADGGEHYDAADICTVPPSLAGLPALSVPCGLSAEGLPLGMQLVGRPYDEATLLQVAYAYEQAAGAARWRLGEEVTARGR